MKCDTCKKDYDWFYELIWNGRYRHADTVFRIRRRKMYVCPTCFDKEITREVSDAVVK